MLTVGARIMSRPRAFTCWATARASFSTSSTFQVAAIAIPAGNDVARPFAALVLVEAEEPAQLRTPIGPSAILIAGMPRRALGWLSIQPEPASIAARS